MPSLARTLDDLRTQALAYPEAHEDFPWGHSAVKIKTKAFAFLFLDPEGTRLTLSTKLPRSSDVALLLPFASPTGYGLGRSGWVTAAFGPRDEIPLDILRGWLDESYRAIAPAKISKTLGPNPPTPQKPAPPLPAPPPAEPSAHKSTTTKKSSAAKPAARATKPAAKKSPARKSPPAKPAARRAAAR